MYILSCGLMAVGSWGRAWSVYVRCVRMVGLMTALAALTACSLSPSSTERRSGQVELFCIDDQGMLRGSMNADVSRTNSRTLLGDFGDPIRYVDDVLTVQVHGAFLASVPATLTGSRDIILFAEVWENAAGGYAAASLNSIVYVARNQIVPGRLNFEGNLAYGPTNFKGHPFKIKFTLMVLQKRSGERAGAIAEIVQNLLGAGAGGIGGMDSALAGVGLGVGSQAIAAIRQILRSQPDVEAFDFEVTLLSDRPERLEAPVLEGVTSENRLNGLPTPGGVERQEMGGVSAGLSAGWSRMNWARYGWYALIETRAIKDRISNRPGRVIPRFEPREYVLDDGWFVHVGKRDPLDANYLVFSITPGQLPQDAQSLAIASNASLALLTSLRQSESGDGVSAGGGVRDSLRQINQAAGRVGLELLEVKAEAIARSIARSIQDEPNREELFVRRFNAAWSAATTGVERDFPREIDETEIKARIERIGAALIGRWVERMRRDNRQMTVVEGNAAA